MELKSLPDIAGEKFIDSSADKALGTSEGIPWVGMEAISLPVRIGNQSLPAEVSGYVNLKPGSSRGIHMSRLYGLTSQRLTEEKVSWDLLITLAKDFVDSQSGISDQGRIRLKMQWPLLRPSLKSEIQSWRLYPIEMEARVQNSGKAFLGLTTEILYSSTCPASTALSREVWKDSLKEQFSSSSLEVKSLMEWIDGQTGMPATPHAQRSKARVKVSFSLEAALCPEEFIKGLEMALSTPVQAFVKRVDEQEFARLNGQNPMFCEDAARRVQNWLDGLSGLIGYEGHFEHQESLHPHNAVAVIFK